MKYSAIALMLISPAVLALEFFGLNPLKQGLFALAVAGFPSLGIFMLFSARALKRPAGIDNDGIYQSSVTSRGFWGIVLAVFITFLYVVIYLGNRMQIGETNLHNIFQSHVYVHFDFLSEFLRGKPADNWFFYGTLYTLAIVLFGVRMIMKFRHSNYQIIRTVSIMFFQLGFAYLLPHILVLFKQPEFYFSYFWPLKPEYLYPYSFASYPSRASDIGAGDGALPAAWIAFFMLGFAAFMAFIATPVLTYFFGKRWYCSWVCGCGGLANTAGDPFRQLSDKSLKAWQVERWLIHSVLVIITGITALLWVNSVSEGKILGKFSQAASEAYGFYIGAIWSGIIGVGFYPLLGTRVWCRFGCPMAAYLGIIQRFFSRFRITTNGGQCISCGNCSTYCEMGIDVRWYAQRGQNIVRASCVGCGMCSAVCPRGVLNLENGTFNEPLDAGLRESVESIQGSRTTGQYVHPR